MFYSRGVCIERRNIVSYTWVCIVKRHRQQPVNSKAVFCTFLIKECTLNYDSVVIRIL